MTPQDLITSWAQKFGAMVEVEQEDDGSGYTILSIATMHGEFNVTVDCTFKDDGTTIIPAGTLKVGEPVRLLAKGELGDYPAPHYDEYDTCQCPDHVAMRHRG